MSSKARTAAIAIAVIIVFAVLVVGFVATVQSTVISTTDSTFVTSSAYYQTITQTSTSTQSVFSGTDVMLKPNYYDSYSAYLPAGTGVQVSWSASDTVNVYIFNSAQYAAYSSSSSTSTTNGGPSTVTSGSGTTGTLQFAAFSTGTYYLVVENPNGGFLGIGSTTVGYSTNGSGAFPVASVVLITQTSTYQTSTPTIVTSTCSHDYWSYLAGANSCS